ncbi:MAG TPA: MaoC family dehydratase N-terminal domain-containing protein [Acetobacteraceae bacterium]|nr:MaoC family dehydratase N-terminal domain-containing protein [Acetobacteraceae bacterium]
MSAALQSWIGRSRSQQDEITRPALLRIAALLDQEIEFATGAPIPPHWYAMFFPEIARQSALGPDGHPRRGDFLPPVALPRRMFAGRRVRFHAPLRVGDVAEKRSEIIAITPKTGRSGAMVFVTIGHRISAGGTLCVSEDQDLVYREAAVPGAASPPPTLAPEAAWQQQVVPSPTLLFRYSAVTWNTHRIHYDADYARGEEGYPALVVNGGLTLLLLLEAAIRVHGRTPAALAVRNLRPLFANAPLTLAGDGVRTAWAADAEGALAVMAEFD